MNNDAIVTISKEKPQLPSVKMTILFMIPLVLPLGLALDLYLPSIPSMATAFATNAKDIQLTMSVFLYCFGLGQLVVGPISDRFGRRNVLLLSLGLFTLGSVICVFSHSLFLLIFGRCLQAFGACGSQVSAFALVRDQHEGKEATLIFTSLKGAMAIAPIGAPILGAFLQVYYGWQANFAVLSVYGLSVLLLALKYTKKTRTPATIKEVCASTFFLKYIKPYQCLLSNLSFIYFGACAAATQAAMFGYFSLSPRYFITLYGLSEAQFAMLFSINACAFLLTSVFAGFWIHRLGFRKSTWIGGLLLIISGSAMAVGHYFYDHYFTLFLPNLIASSSASLMLGASASGAMMPFKEKAGAAAAMFGCLEFMGGALIGSQALRGNEITVLPLAMILLALGMMIVLVNYFFKNQFEQYQLTYQFRKN